MLFKTKMGKPSQNVVINVLKYTPSNFATEWFGNKIRSHLRYDNIGYVGRKRRMETKGFCDLSRKYKEICIC